MYEHVYVFACAGWGYTRHKIDPSRQIFSQPVPGQRERKSKRWQWGSLGWGPVGPHCPSTPWGLVADGGWGPTGMGQPANEEPSETSIHLEHGPLQLPWPWLWSTKMLDPHHSPRTTPLPSGVHACICIRMCTHPQIHMHVHIYTCTCFLHRCGIRFCSCWCLLSNMPLFGMLATFCVFVHNWLVGFCTSVFGIHTYSLAGSCQLKVTEREQGTGWIRTVTHCNIYTLPTKC